jgi:hypothetical protein
MPAIIIKIIKAEREVVESAPEVFPAAKCIGEITFFFAVN